MAFGVGCGMATDHELLLVIGLGLVCLSLPSLFAALIDDRPPFVAGFGLLLGAGLAGWGLVTATATVHPGDLPGILFSVLGRYLF